MKISLAIIVLALIVLSQTQIFQNLQPSDGFYDVSSYQILIRVALAVLIGSLIGLERTQSRKEAGVRTFALVTLGACVYTLIGLLGATVTDPTRIISQIVVGISFLGAGVIWFHEDKLMGLTTSAGLWVSAAIGGAIGLGLYSLALITASANLIILHYFLTLEEKIK